MINRFSHQILASALTLVIFLNPYALFAKSSASQLDQLFQAAADSNTVPGISVAIANNSGVIYAKGFGFADIENKVPMSPTTKLRIGSVSKVMATAALMRMVEDNKVDLAVNVEDLVDAWPKTHADINFYHLTGHTSGIRHYQGSAEFLSNKQYNSRVESLNIFKDDPLRFTPGEKFGYSTYAWTLISAALEKADGKRDFNQLMQDYVFNPLNMKHSLLEKPLTEVAESQKPYSVSAGKLVDSREVNNSYKYAGGGILSTPTDVVNFAMAHTKPGYLKKQTLEQMFTNQRFNDGKKNQYGIGWRVGFERQIARLKGDSDEEKRLVEIMQRHPNSVFHSGGSMGASSMLILCLDHNHAAAMVKNVDGDRSSNLMNLTLLALDVAMGDPYK
ncbi:beta-lactamase family protein [Aliikangiella marina]|uniref:Beta-lactamase family protein n=1 Tax=Aliikangiella marina TaxID=1712262 RepID=A0A545T6Y0_9GAMM|nr:serine hydrolase domain-containing protein [Aliikangiella marina]TQV72932.1 beta-lactamase family protein [Aliikangiella marina]